LLPKWQRGIGAIFWNGWKGIVRQDIRAASHTREDQSICFQLGVGIFNRRAVDAQITRKLTTGRQAGVGEQVSRKDRLAQICPNLLVKRNCALSVEWDTHFLCLRLILAW